MGIVGWLLDKLVTWTFDCVGYLLVWFTNFFAEIFGFNFGTFQRVFPGYSSLLKVIIGFSIAIAFLIYIWQLIRCMTGAISGDVDDPFLMSFKLIFVVFAIFFWWSIVNFLVDKIFKTPFKLIGNWGSQTFSSVEASKKTGEITRGTLSNSLNSFLNALKDKKWVESGKNLVKFEMNLDPTGMMIVVKLILIIAIGWNYVKYLIEYIERYVLFMFLTLLGPLAVATGVSRQTNDISKKFARMYASSFFMILMAHLGLVMISLGFLNCAKATKSLNFTVWCLIIYATLIVLQKIDKHFAAAGMNTAQTGGAMLDLAATAMSTFKSLQKSGQGFLTGLTGVKGGLAGLAGNKMAENRANSKISPLLSKISGGDIGAYNEAKTIANGIKSPLAKAAALKEIENAKKEGANALLHNKANKLEGMSKQAESGNIISPDDYKNSVEKMALSINDEAKKKDFLDKAASEGEKIASQANKNAFAAFENSDKSVESLEKLTKHIDKNATGYGVSNVGKEAIQASAAPELRRAALSSAGSNNSKLITDSTKQLYSIDSTRMMTDSYRDRSKNICQTVPSARSEVERTMNNTFNTFAKNQLKIAETNYGKDSVQYKNREAMFKKQKWIN